MFALTCRTSLALLGSVWGAPRTGSRPQKHSCDPTTHCFPYLHTFAPTSCTNPHRLVRAALGRGLCDFVLTCNPVNWFAALLSVSRCTAEGPHCCTKWSALPWEGFVLSYKFAVPNKEVCAPCPTQVSRCPTQVSRCPTKASRSPTQGARRCTGGSHLPATCSHRCTKQSAVPRAACPTVRATYQVLALPYRVVCTALPTGVVILLQDGFVRRGQWLAWRNDPQQVRADLQQCLLGSSTANLI